MNIKKSLIALSVFSILMGGVWEAAVAKNADKEQDSVKRWGRWAVLSPAAGQEEAGLTTIAAANDLGSCESSENCPGIQPVGEPVEPPPGPGPATADLDRRPGPEVKSPCEAGMPCGFARIDHPFDSEEVKAPTDSDVVPFELTLKEEEGGIGTVEFVVDPDSESEIRSDNAVPAGITPPSSQIGSVMTDPGGSSNLFGTFLRNEAGDPVVSQGRWSNDGFDFENDHSINDGGEYVWGITAKAGEMQSLISSLGGDMTAVYQGKTMGSVNGTEGAVRLEVNFSSDTWTGAFNNDPHNERMFTASGVVVGSGFVSNANGFSNTVASGDVKGAFVNAGNNAIGGYEVEFKNGLKDADVFSTKLQD